jgi:ribosomal protein S18 acetylase RimI-like enzyme
MIEYRWRGDIDNVALERLHAEGFGHPPAVHDWRAQLTEHSLGWVCAHDGDELVGFVNVAWDGAVHAFVLDTLVAPRLRRHGIGTELIAHAAREARAAHCEWLHVDFDDHLRAFYVDGCGFTPTPAGLIAL